MTWQRSTGSANGAEWVEYRNLEDGARIRVRTACPPTCCGGAVHTHIEQIVDAELVPAATTIAQLDERFAPFA